MLHGQRNAKEARHLTSVGLPFKFVFQAKSGYWPTDRNRLNSPFRKENLDPLTLISVSAEGYIDSSGLTANGDSGFQHFSTKQFPYIKTDIGSSCTRKRWHTLVWPNLSLHENSPNFRTPVRHLSPDNQLVGKLWAISQTDCGNPWDRC